MKDRFSKLTALTRGAAVITLGVGASGVTAAVAAGCSKNDPSPPPVSAEAIQPDPAAADPGDAGFHGRRRFPIPNAMHPPWHLRDGGAGPSDGGTNDGS